MTRFATVSTIEAAPGRSDEILPTLWPVEGRAPMTETVAPSPSVIHDALLPLDVRPSRDVPGTQLYFVQ